MNETYIYALHDPRDWEIRYVGKANNPYRRLRGHIKVPVRIAFRNLVDELKDQGMMIQISILQKCPISQWQHWERFWIAAVRNSGANLFNLTEGGGGYLFESLSAASRGRKHTPESCAKMSASRMGMKHRPESYAKTAEFNRGKPLTSERRAKISAAHKGKKLTAAHREKIRIGGLGKRHKLSPEGRDAIIAMNKARIKKGKYEHSGHLF